MRSARHCANTFALHPSQPHTRADAMRICAFPGDSTAAHSSKYTDSTRHRLPASRDAKDRETPLPCAFEGALRLADDDTTAAAAAVTSTSTHPSPSASPSSHRPCTASISTSSASATSRCVDAAVHRAVKGNVFAHASTSCATRSRACRTVSCTPPLARAPSVAAAATRTDGARERYPVYRSSCCEAANLLILCRAAATPASSSGVNATCSVGCRAE